MKTKYIICFLLCVMGLSALGQNTVETPWGSSVDVWTQGDMTTTQRYTSDSNHAIEYPNADFHPTLNNSYPSSTSKFNCHGYAWYMHWEDDEFDAPWNMHDTEAETYFDDPSYVECTQAEADIWWINDGSHSALATGITGWLLSKWDTGPLATHETGDEDFPSAPIESVKYYKRCGRVLSTTFYSSTQLTECSLKLENSSVSNYVELEIEYEEVILIEGPFSTGTGSSFFIYPD